MLDREGIRSCIAQLGHQARLTEAGSKLTVEFDAGGQAVMLVHPFEEELLAVPKFYLDGGHAFGKLAHVLPRAKGDLGEVCVADSSSTAVNTDRPELAYRDTVQEHVRLLTRLIEDPEYNRVEQLREFEAHWEILCRNADKGYDEIFVAWDGDATASLQVKPPRSASGSDIRKTHIAFANSPPAPVHRVADLASRQTVGKALGLRLVGLDPAPATREELLPWYFNAISRADVAGRRECQRLSKKSSRDYWLVFSAPIPDGESMFAIHWRSRSAGPLPSSSADVEAGQWTLTPYRVRSISRRSLVPRGGGSLDLDNKHILLVGCGSVGGELALQLTSAGVGHLTLCDPDTFSEVNLYRHILTVEDIGRFKTEALADEIGRRHPWVEVTHWCKRLAELRDLAALRPFDLVVVATGSPTVERVFAEYCHREALDVPVMNCWLEGYGIGGHAILAMPGRKGCWHCAYVDPDTLTRGLASNLNFLKPGQVVMRNQGGCGTQFLPYSGIAASCTATMAADMAVRVLAGGMTTSSKVSWIGCDAEVRRASLETTWRHRHFTESLRALPLHDVNCDICGG